MDNNELLAKGLEYLQIKEIDAAISCFEKVLEAEPHNVICYFGIANAYEIKKNYELAIRCYIKVIELDPGIGAAYSNLGILLKLNGNMREAEVCYRKAVELDPDDPINYINLGILLNKKGHKEEAESCFRKAVEVDPDDPKNYYNLGNILSDKSHTEEAESCYRKAIELDSDNPLYHSNLGVLLDHIGHTAEAESCFRRTIELDPGNGSAYSNLGYILSNKGYSEEAESCFRKAIKLDLGFAPPYIGLGALFLITEPEKAYKYLAKAKSIDHYLPACYYYLSQIDFEINVNRERDFYRTIYLCIVNSDRKMLHQMLSSIVQHGAPMLTYNVLTIMPIENWDSLSTYNIPINENLQQTQHFRWLIQVWRNEAKHREKSLLSEAIINYHLGDPVKAFLIFDREMENDDISLNLCGQYYFCLSAYTIMEEEGAIVAAAVKQADACHANNNTLPLSEKYYAALIYYQAGQFDKAISILQAIYPHYPVAGYKLVEIYGALKNEKARYTLIEEIVLKEQVDVVYRFGLTIVEPSHEEDRFLEDIMPVVHFMEVQETVGEIFSKPLDIRNAFCNGIQLGDDDAKKENLTLKEKAAKAWQETVEETLDKEELEDLFNGYSNFKNPAKVLGERIHDGAKAELFDAKGKHQQPTHFKFKLYLALNYRLYKEGFISHTDAMSINDYMYACMDALPVFHKNEAKKFVIDSVRDHFLDDAIMIEAIPVIGYIKKLHKLVSLIKTEMYQKPSPIMNFGAFLSLYQKVNEETGI